VEFSTTLYMNVLNCTRSLKINLSTVKAPSSSNSPKMHFFSSCFFINFFKFIFNIKVQGDRHFHVLSDYVLTFAMTRFNIKIIEKLIKKKNKKLKKMKRKNAFSGNLMMRVPLLCLNLFSVNECNLEPSYTEL